MNSRTQVATYIASRLKENRADAIQEAAAWLIDTKRPRQAKYLARDVARILATEGYLALDITTARELSADTKDELARYAQKLTGAREVESHYVIHPDVIGGVLLETPTAQIDATIKRRLTEFVEGAIR